MKSKFITATLAILLVSILAIGIVNFTSGTEPVKAAAMGVNQDKSTISVNGSYTQKVAPNIAYISIGVQTFSKESKEAQKQNTEKMDKVYKALESLGIDKKDIETINYSIYPQYQWKNTANTNERILTGYEVNNMVRVTVHDLKMVGNVIDMTVQEGVNKANAISFGISDEKREEIYLEALKKAVENAKGKAEAMASVYDITLGNPVNITEGSSHVSSPLPYRNYAADALVKTEESVATPISAGELEVQANVNVVYEY